jgi:hypothetical protein
MYFPPTLTLPHKGGGTGNNRAPTLPHRGRGNIQGHSLTPSPSMGEGRVGGDILIAGGGDTRTRSGRDSLSGVLFCTTAIRDDARLSTTQH